MKKITFLLLLCPFFLFAQDKTTVPDSLKLWKKGGIASLNFTQASYTNWASGGVNSVSIQTLVGLYANYKKETMTWDNTLDLGYGLLKQGTKGTVQKMDDKIDFSSKYGRYAFRKVWYYSALLGFRTQFAPGYNYTNGVAGPRISDFMAPAYALMAIGLDYKPNDHFTMLISPITGRTTFVMSPELANAGAFGVTKAVYDANGLLLTPGEKIRNEFGGYIRVQYKKEVVKNITLNARCELFSNYLNNPQNVDVNAELLVLMKVNKYITASVNVQGIYDHDINIAYDSNSDGIMDRSGPRLQLRQVLGIGFSAKF
jgi:Protein of unknown function (DUF3078)